MRPLLSPSQRNRSRLLLTVLSGTLAAATGAGTVAATAAAAQESTREQTVKDLAHALAEAEAARAHHEALLEWAADNRVVVTLPRPVRTVIGPEILVGASSPGSAEVGGSSRSSSPGSSGMANRPAPPQAPPATSAGS